MARLTIEEKWWIDPRRTFLQTQLRAVGGGDADGVMIHTWRLAQDYWGQGQLMPWRVFSKIPEHQQILAADLAEIRTGAELNSKPAEHPPNTFEQASNTWVYVRGSRDFFSWIYEIREKRSLGGKNSAERRRSLYGSAIPRNASNAPEIAKKPKTRRTPAEDTPNSTEVLGSVLGSGLENNNIIGGENVKTKTPPKPDLGLATDPEKCEAMYQAEAIGEIQNILDQAYGGAAPKYRVRSAAQVLAHFQAPEEFAGWVEGVINGKNCPDPGTDWMGFDKYFSSAIRNTLDGQP